MKISETKAETIIKYTQVHEIKKTSETTGGTSSTEIQIQNPEILCKI